MTRTNLINIYNFASLTVNIYIKKVELYHCTHIALFSIDVTLKVLTTGYWPTQQQAQSCQLPKTAQDAFNEFKNFYLAKHSGRQLTLQANMGNADLNAVFYGTPKKKSGDDDEVDASTSSQPAPNEKPKERKHILSVCHQANSNQA